jgi:hypothetical protein
VFKTCGEYLVFKEKFEWNDCSEVVIKLLAINRKNKFELFLSNLLSLSFKSFATRVTKISNTVLAKAFDQPISEVVDTISGEQHTMELASINTNVKTLLDKQVSTLALTPIATPSNISQFDINQIYFGDEEIKAI